MIQRLAQFVQARTSGGPASASWLPTAATLLEAVFWTTGYLLAQGVVLVGVVALFLTSAYGVRWPDAEGIVRLILDLDLDRSFLLIGASSIGALFLIGPAIRLREGRGFRERIGWRPPTREEVVFSLATVVPIAVLGDLVYGAAGSWWQNGAPLWPCSAALRDGSLQEIHRAAGGVSFPVVVVALALAPAVGEELVFRGVLGRRLIRRFGTLAGVLLSSVCFAAAHGSLPHAIATLPVGVLLHLLYLETRTIWIPILVHFCNNLLAVSMVRYNLGQDAPASGMLVAALSLHLLAMLALLHVRASRWRCCGRIP